MKLLGEFDVGTSGERLLYGVGGLVLVVGIWYLITAGSSPILEPGIMPTPFKVVQAFGALFNENELLKNIGRSLGLNISGYLEAILLVIPVGFIIGLFKYTRWGFQRQVDALRYIPLTAVTLLFILWFGTGVSMKVNFLAFGILIYLLPVMVQRIDEVGDVYLKTVHTLGASDWQTIKTVYFPSVISRLSDDIRVLTAISWTYIIVAEGINSNQGGIGALIYYVGQRQGRPDKMFALLLIIMMIGLLQDKAFVWLDRQFFPHKYQAQEAVKSSSLKQKTFFNAVGDYTLVAFGWIAVGIYFLMMINEYFSFLGQVKPLSYLFGETLWVINFIFISFLALQAWKWYKRRTDMMVLQNLSVKSQARK